MADPGSGGPRHREGGGESLRIARLAAQPRVAATCRDTSSPLPNDGCD
jgi:hypothetical protein